MAIPGSGILTGMATTMRNLFAPKVTRQYPEERPQMPERWRGRLDPMSRGKRGHGTTSTLPATGTTVS